MTISSIQPGLDIESRSASPPCVPRRRGLGDMGMECILRLSPSLAEERRPCCLSIASAARNSDNQRTMSPSTCSSEPLAPSKVLVPGKPDVSATPCGEWPRKAARPLDLLDIQFHFSQHRVQAAKLGLQSPLSPDRSRSTIATLRRNDFAFFHGVDQSPEKKKILRLILNKPEAAPRRSGIAQDIPHAQTSRPPPRSPDCETSGSRLPFHSVRSCVEAIAQSESGVFRNHS